MTLDQGFADRIEERKRNRAVDGDRSGGSAEAGPRPCLLVVDDEPEITRSIAETLTDDYEVITAGSADEAVALLASRSVAVILTDQRMPGGTGAELLSRSLDIAPETTRILFTGYSDISAVIEAVNEGQVYHYIAKPWRPDELRTVVRQGLERYGLAVENRRLLTELTAANQQLADSNESLREANLDLEVEMRTKNDFLAAMSHELRTPLNSIIGFSGTLLQGLAGDLNDEQSKQLRMVNAAGNHLLTLVDEVLELAEIESGHNEPHIAQLDLGPILRQACEAIRPAAAGKGIEVRCVCPDSVEPLETDGRFVAQILLNLLDNAVRFTERGYVAVTVDQDAAGTVIAVEDTGCGIDAEEQARIFEDYFQGARGDVAKNEGMGLGLAISRRLAEALGARIDLESEAGSGSVFTLRIPVAKP